VRYVLDANIAVAALNGVGVARSRLEDVPSSEVGIPIVAIAELVFGAHKSQRRDANLQRIAALRRSITVVNLDDRIVDLYGSIRAALERRGIVKSDEILRKHGLSF
jgi:tRNA(fMet)-specific endonuclease VapC